MKERILIATVKNWNIRNARSFISANRDRFRVKLVTSRDGLTPEQVRKFKPRFIFFPHWSWLIPEEIYSGFECVVFHMTDLPFGRGGSPLQNLISRGLRSTKISALRAVRDLDAGPVYMKMTAGLHGSAQEIYERISGIIFRKMIPRLLSRRPVPKPQSGRPVFFRRRSPADSRLPVEASPEALHDFIRMLDAEGYPPAFIDLDSTRLEFRSARKSGRSFRAEVSIVRKRGI